jgi:hypothetical protein
MKKILIAVFAVAAGVSAAGAQERAVNFDGAAVPMPKLERVQGAGEAQQALAGAVMPQRAAAGEEKSSLGWMLRQAGKKKSVTGGPVLHCEFTGEAPYGNELCQVECCLMDDNGDGEPDGTDCHITPYCTPKPDYETPRKSAKAASLSELLKMRKENKKTRGPYEDCVNYCIDAYLGCSGDADPKPCNDSYQRCINVCDNVVDPKTR